MDLDDLIVPGMGVVLLGFVIFTGGGDSVGSMLSSGSEIKELRDAAALQKVLSASQQEAIGDRSALAIDRFNQGCIVHLKRSEVQRPEDLAIGAISVDYMPIKASGTPVNWQTGTPYSPGAVVCDWTGGTGIIGPDGTVTDYAFTGEDISGNVATNMEKFR